MRVKLTEEERRVRANETKRRWAENNKDKVKAARDKWKQANVEKVKEAKRRWNANHPDDGRKRYAANPEKARQQRANWVKNNPEKRAEICRKYFLANKEKIYARDTVLRLAHPERATASRHKRRTKLQTSKFPIEQWKNLLKLFGSHCPYCKTSGHKLTVDHLVPVSAGGTNDIWNLVPCCKPCNSSKGAKDLNDWLPTLTAV